MCTAGSGALEASRERAYRLWIVSEAAAVGHQRWGLVSYEEALQRQLELCHRRREGEIGDVVVEVEHPPTITLGRHAPDSDLLLSPELLAARGVSVLRSDRGGRATFHGPGQAVIYPIVKLDTVGLGVRQWVAMLEDEILALLAEYDIEASAHEGSPGLWVGDAKIASVGLRVAGGISYHGVAVNVSLDLGGFGYIVTCGVPDERVTTMVAERGTELTSASVSARLSERLIRRLEERHGSR